MPRDSDLKSYKGWPKGVNNVASETAVPSDSLREAQNVDLTPEGKPRLRAGYALKLAGSNVHSLWADAARALFVDAGVLKRLLPDYSAQTLRSGLDQNAYLSYEGVNGEVYYSNGETTGRVDTDNTHQDWGVEDPAGQPLLAAAASGSLDAGRYQVAIAYVSAQGELSGASLATLVDIAEGQGIQLSNIPQPLGASVAKIRAFVSEANGTALYRQVDIPLGATSYLIPRTIKGEPLETQFLRQAPAGHIVRHYNGRNLIASGKVLFYTQALRYGLYHPAEDYIQFPQRITVVEPVIDGVYVCADQTYFLAGAEIKQAQLVVANPRTGVEGTGARVDARMFDLDGVTGRVAYWFSAGGAMLGLPGGTVQAATQDQLAISGYNSGATLFRERDGLRQLITSLQGKGEGSSFAASDTVTAEVIRNGITI